MRMLRVSPRTLRALLLALSLSPAPLVAQGVTTAAINGLVVSTDGSPVEGATVTALHVPSGTQYRGLTRTGGAYNIVNMRIGGPYRVTATRISFRPATADNIFISIAQSQRVDFTMTPATVELTAVRVTAERDEVLNGGRTGAETVVDATQVAQLPSIKRSTRDLTRLDPRSDGNYSFAGRNWLYNSISIDGSYFNNAFGLDDPAPGGQTNAEPLPYDAVAQVQVSVAPFDVTQSGFTGASVNIVTKSGTNSFTGTGYSFARTDALQGNKVSGATVFADPSLKYNQSGVGFGGPIIRDKLFFYVSGEIERTEDPGSNFVARAGAGGFGVSRVERAIMDSIRDRMIQEYDYDPGAYEGLIFNTDNNKLLAKLDWNISDVNKFSVRYNFLDAERDLPPHPFVLSFGSTGRGPNESSLPFSSAGYRMNNNLHSIAAELNSQTSRFGNRFFASYSRFRDFREPASEPFPTIEIAEEGVTYTTLGIEPFSEHNILDQDVLQLTNNLTWFAGKHSLTLGANYETFEFFNSFNIFRNGVFFLPAGVFTGTTFGSLEDFFDATDPANPDQIDFRSFIGTGPFKGEEIKVGLFSLYAQDAFLVSDRLNLTYGVRIDMPKYYTKPVDNPYSRSLDALDENRNPEVIDQSKLPGSDPLWSPRVGFNWNAVGDRQTQLRGGTGFFTGRIPFVWVGNAISNPGANPNLYPAGPIRPTRKGSTLAQSFDVNAMDPDFKFPQVWTTDLAIDQRLPWNMLATLEAIYSKDRNSIFMRNADLRAPVGTLPDGRPFYGGAGANELNPDGGAGIYVIDNTDEGYSFNISGQLRKTFGIGAQASIGYSYTTARNNLKSTEIASVLWQNQPVQGDPNNPELSYSEFGQRHRIIGSGTYTKSWSETFVTHFGIFAEAAEGNRFAGAGGNRYSFIYSGDVNGDGSGGNDLIYIPRDADDILLADYEDRNRRIITVAEQRTRLEAFIEQDDYLRENRGKIAERFGAVNPWYTNVDLRIMQDFAFGGAGRGGAGGQRHAMQLSLDILNAGNLLNSDWGVRKGATAAATSPIRLVDFDAGGAPIFNFTGPAKTFEPDPGLTSRWRAQLGLRYLFNQ